MITPDGKTVLRRFLATYGAGIADTIAIGLEGSDGPAMRCEWARFPVTSVGTNPDSSQIIFKSSSNIGLVGQIYEIGLLQGAGGISNDVYLSNFTDVQQQWTGGSFTTTNVRLGQGLKVLASQSASCVLNGVSLEKFNDDDILTLAGFCSATGTVKITLDFNNGSSAAVTFNVLAGYRLFTLSKKNMVKTGNVDWQQITKLTINPSVDYTADLLKVSVSKPLGETLIARTALAQPFITSVNLPLEIEYPLGVSLDAS